MGSFRSDLINRKHGMTDYRPIITGNYKLKKNKYSCAEKNLSNQRQLNRKLRSGAFAASAADIAAVKLDNAL